tara:strand:- start:1613 stop:2761 length:1149 start_codon:yes stop_codon:yes gene_type:complete
MVINLRSPYTIGTAQINASYAILDLYIWDGDSSDSTLPVYSLKKNSINSTSNTSIFFELSELIKDYIDLSFNGNYDFIENSSIWFKTVQTVYNSSDAVIYTSNDSTKLGLDGYLYFEEFESIPPSTLITNRELFVLEDNVFRVPIYVNGSPTVVFYKDGKVIASEVFTPSTDSSGQIKYVSIFGDSFNWDTFQERVKDSLGDYELNPCLQSFFDDYSIGAVDKITVSDGNGIETIKVNVIEECKYEPKKVTFINKFGALQDMYFFKKSKENLTIKKESYKSNIVTTYGTYQRNNHVNRDFNVIGNESISLSSGYLSEEYNEVFKQLLLSEKVWVTNILETGEQVVPINVKTSSIAYKTSVNDKLVDYTIEFNKSFDTINNIR